VGSLLAGFLPVKRVLVTGAGGFLGSHCLDVLAGRGWTDIHAVSRKGGGTPGVTWHACDLLNPDMLRQLVRSVKPTHALHLAWCTKPGEYWTSPENLDWVAASIGLLEEFARVGGKRFVAAGSCAEYEWGHGLCSETATTLAPRSPYGVAKHKLQTSLSRLGPTLGISIAWGRLFFPYGPHERPERLVAYVIRSLLAGKPALCTEGNQVRDFVYARDAAEAFGMLLESELVGALNIASGEAVSVKSVVEEVGAQLDRKDLIRLGARTMPATDPALLIADVTRLQNELGWQQRTTLTDGIAATIAYWSHAGSEEDLNARDIG